jgi:HEAT repeat protein
MKCVTVLCIFLVIAPTLYHAQEDSSLKAKIKLIFLNEDKPIDLKVEIEKLGRRERVTPILLDMLKDYRYTQEGTSEFLYLYRAVWVLGAFKERRASSPLASLLLDQRVHENVRTVAAESLGKIDAEGNKEVLLKVLDPKMADYPFIRIEAAKALAKTDDRQALKAIERLAAKERDTYVKQKLGEAASELKQRIQRDHMAQPKKGN